VETGKLIKYAIQNVSLGAVLFAGLVQRFYEIRRNLTIMTF